MQHFPALLTRPVRRTGGSLLRTAARYRLRPLGRRDPGIDAVHRVRRARRPRWEAEFTPCTEIGWRLARSAWGHGYATEAANAALATAFGPAGLDEVVSFTTIGNSRSQRVMQRIGMIRDPAGDFDHPRISDGTLRRHVLYRLKSADWRPPASR